MKFTARLRRLLPLRYDLHFNDGPYVRNRSRYRRITARFLLDDKLEYEVTLGHRQWGRPFKRYLAPWRIEILDETGTLVHEHRFDPAGRRVRINLDSRSLGDTLAWIPQIARFAAAHPDATVYCSHFWPALGMDVHYPGIRFIAPDTPLPDCYATFAIGYYLGDKRPHRHPVDPRTVPLGQVASDILGMPYLEKRPRLTLADTNRTIAGPYVCIATHATAGCKLWQQPGGWQRLIDHLNERGLKVVLIQKEAADYDGIINRTGDHPIQERMRDLHHCELFIGLGSGLSWLAWALDRPVIMIGGFSEPFTEFQDKCHRVINRDVCTGCWNDTSVTFERGDWDWCPRHRDDGRRFECSTAITPAMVIAAVDEALAASSGTST